LLCRVVERGVGIPGVDIVATLVLPVFAWTARLAFANPGAAMVYGAAHPGDGQTPLALLLGGSVLAVALWLGLQNHRSAERTAARVIRQTLALAGCVALGLAAWVMASTLGWSFLQYD
jgi:hypothetical protein